MQIIVDVGMTPEEYVAHRGHETIPAPQGCPNARCGNHRRLHRHMKYERGLSGLPTAFCVAVFLCSQCRKTVSCLPSFALPYRYVRVATVEAYLRGETKDPDVQHHEHLLQRYLKDLQLHLALLLRRLGYFLGKAPFSSVKDFWRALKKKCEGLMNGSRILVMDFGLGLFRQYAVHAWARESVCGVGSPKRRARTESG
jgi:hypothetical protein